jgi:hypothetical protein
MRTGRQSRRQDAGRPRRRHHRRDVPGRGWRVRLLVTGPIGRDEPLIRNGPAAHGTPDQPEYGHGGWHQRTRNEHDRAATYWSLRTSRKVGCVSVEAQDLARSGTPTGSWYLALWPFASGTAAKGASSVAVTPGRARTVRSRRSEPVVGSGRVGSVPVSCW